MRPGFEPAAIGGFNIALRQRGADGRGVSQQASDLEGRRQVGEVTELFAGGMAAESD